MLAITLKDGEALHLGENIVIIVKPRGKKVRLLITAPRALDATRYDVNGQKINSKKPAAVQPLTSPEK